MEQLRYYGGHELICLRLIQSPLIFQRANCWYSSSSSMVHPICCTNLQENGPYFCHMEGHKNSGTKNAGLFSTVLYQNGNVGPYRKFTTWSIPIGWGWVCWGRYFRHGRRAVEMWVSCWSLRRAPCWAFWPYVGRLLVEVWMKLGIWAGMDVHGCTWMYPGTRDFTDSKMFFPTQVRVSNSGCGHAWTGT
jgi:hypothetical protein